MKRVVVLLLAVIIVIQVTCPVWGKSKVYWADAYYMTIGTNKIGRANLDGTEVLKDEITGEKDKAEEWGITLAKRLLDAGGREILRDIYKKI